MQRKTSLRSPESSPSPCYHKESTRFTKLSSKTSAKKQSLSLSNRLMKPSREPSHKAVRPPAALSQKNHLRSKATYSKWTKFRLEPVDQRRPFMSRRSTRARERSNAVTSRRNTILRSQMRLNWRKKRLSLIPTSTKREATQWYRKLSINSFP